MGGVIGAQGPGCGRHGGSSSSGGVVWCGVGGGNGVSGRGRKIGGGKGRTG